MSAGKEYWIVAAAGGGEYLQKLKFGYRSAVGPASQLNVPTDLKFGSFDNLVRLTDDLQKYDGQIDSILHRLERSYLEINPQATFKVKTRGQEKDFDTYLNNWQWDEGMFSRQRPITDVLATLMKKINNIDDETRNKTAQYNDAKSVKGGFDKKEGANLLTRELADVLTPDVVVEKGTADDDFIYTDHLTTVCCVLVRGAENEFLSCYETFVPKVVVPQSARKLNASDKDKNTVWRVVVLKKGEEEFRRQCRAKKFLPREFTYDKQAYVTLQKNRADAEKNVNQQQQIVTAVYKGSWSDVAVAWMHIKAMRVFVECVLRFGSPPNFEAFVVSPKVNAVVAARKALAFVCGGNKQPPGGDEKQEDDGEEFFPYVSLSFIPFVVEK